MVSSDSVSVCVCLSVCVSAKVLKQGIRGQFCHSVSLYVCYCPEG